MAGQVYDLGHLPADLEDRLLAETFEGTNNIADLRSFDQRLLTHPQPATAPQSYGMNGFQTINPRSNTQPLLVSHGLLEPVNRVIPMASGMNHSGFQAVATRHFDTGSGQALPICLDTGAFSSLVDRNVLATHFPHVPIQQMSSGVSMRGVGNATLVTTNCVTLTLNLRSLSGHFVQVRGEFHVLPVLAPNILVGANMLYEYGVTIDVGLMISRWGRTRTLVPCNIWRGAPRTHEVSHPPPTTSQSDGMNGVQTTNPRSIIYPLSVSEQLIDPTILEISRYQRLLNRQTPR